MGIDDKYTCTVYKYTKITTGATCERIKSKAHCEEAAKELGLSDTSPSDENTSGWPPYCYFLQGIQGITLYFNTGHKAIQSSVKECNSDSMVCLCHKYYRVTEGSTCERVTSKAECELAAKQLDLSDTEALVEDKSDWPPFCYLYKGRSLFYNTAGNNASECNSDSVCICKKR